MSDPRPLTRRQALASAAALSALALTGCSAASPAPAEDERATVSDRPAPGAGDPSDADPLAAEVSAALDKLTLEQKVAQLFIVRPEALTGVGQVTAAGETTRAALAEMPVAGICYFAANLLDADQTREMLSNTMEYGREANGLPMFLCVDEEGGTVSRVGGNPGFGVDNVGDMCDVGTTGDAAYAEEVAKHIGTYLDYLGFNVDFAPDADIANNPDGTMGLRSFGSTADVVAPMVAAQVRGFTDAGVLCAAKHFPGIGGALGDSHEVSIYSEKTLDEIRAEELRPFEAAIEEDVPFVMVGHLSMPSITGDDDPATISSEIVTDLLRGELGYEGIIITDSMGMGAATEAVGVERVAAAALLAGVDIVLMPADLQAAYQGVLDAVASGELTEERIDESVRRILTVKLGRLG